MGWLEWVLQLVLVLLLATLLPFAIRLERRLAAVRGDRAAIERSAAGLTEATRMAEAASLRLRAAAESAGRGVAEKLAAAEPLRDDLRYLTERAEAIADRLEGLVRVARPLAQEAAPTAAAAPVAAAAARGTAARSEAERELLRALKLAR